jgi:CheY-like chemotaxis protein
MPKRFLLVDADPVGQAALQNVATSLEGEGVTATTSEEARTRLRAEPFDVCIVDMSLPDGGAQVISTAQADSKGSAEDIYNPAWGVRANCQYMMDLECTIYRDLEQEERIKFRNSKRLRELYCCSAYNCGSYRVVRAIQSQGIEWAQTKNLLPNESTVYAERVVTEKEKWFGR